MERKEPFKAGHWIEGETWDKQRIYGYVVKVGQPEDILKVYVVHSANEELKGRMIHVLSKSIQKVSEQTPAEAAIEQLVDLALLTKDQEWFEQLSAQLHKLRVQYS